MINDFDKFEIATHLFAECGVSVRGSIELDEVLTRPCVVVGNDEQDFSCDDIRIIKMSSSSFSDLGCSLQTIKEAKYVISSYVKAVISAKPTKVSLVSLWESIKHELLEDGYDEFPDEAFSVDAFLKSIPVIGNVYGKHLKKVLIEHITCIENNINVLNVKCRTCMKCKYKTEDRIFKGVCKCMIMALPEDMTVIEAEQTFGKHIFVRKDGEGEYCLFTDIIFGALTECRSYEPRGITNRQKAMAYIDNYLFE